MKGGVDYAPVFSRAHACVARRCGDCGADVAPQYLGRVVSPARAGWPLAAAPLTGNTSGQDCRRLPFVLASGLVPDRRAEATPAGGNALADRAALARFHGLYARRGHESGADAGQLSRHRAPSIRGDARSTVLRGAA